jgi:hypothetical protein
MSSGIFTKIFGFFDRLPCPTAIGAILWGVFVGRVIPPGTSDLHALLLVSISILGIGLFAKGICLSVIRQTRKNDGEGRTEQ